jgi:aryl-alcohol dehydrogenase-like predicted oxidoreductase
MTEQPANRVRLGKADLLVSQIGVGTNAWGGNRQADPGLRSTFEAALDAGINLFDTAEIYNFGGSEKTLGQFLPEAGRPVVVTTKFLPLPWRLGKGSLGRALHASLGRLNLACVDLYLVHFPLPPVAIETWMEALAEAKAAGLVRAVGVSNYNVEQLRRAQSALAKHGIPLACNQVEFSLLKRDIEHNGVLAACQELGVTVVAYRPFAGGFLSGKYTPENPPKGLRRRMYRVKELAKVQPLIARMRQAGEAHGGKSPSQVALNWLICKGALPIPGATKVKHIQENVGALGWSLTEEEVSSLEEVKI